MKHQQPLIVPFLLLISGDPTTHHQLCLILTMSQYGLTLITQAHMAKLAQQETGTRFAQSMALGFHTAARNSRNIPWIVGTIAKAPTM